MSLRYLKSRFSGLAALASVAFGVAVIVIVLGIMGGYIVELRKSIRGQESHLMIVGPRPFSVGSIARLEKLVSGVGNVKATAPFVETLAMYRSGQFNPCQLRGILPAKQVRVSSIGNYVFRPDELDRLLAELKLDEAPQGRAEVESRKSGRPAVTHEIHKILDAPGREPLGPEELEKFFQRDFRIALLQSKNPTVLPDLQESIPPACLVGIGLLLDREMFLGQVVTIVTLHPESSEPIARHFLVAGAFKTGDYEADSKAIYVHVDTLKNLLGLFDPESNSYRYEGLRVELEDLGKIHETQKALQAVMDSHQGGLRVLTWEKLRSNLLSAVSIEKFVIYFLLVLLVSFTACMVLLMLLLTVIEKTRDMGVLLALGATPGGILKIFLANGMILSVAGTLLGLLLGHLFCAYINPIHDWIYALTGKRFFPAEIYHMDRIPIAFQPTDLILSITPPALLGFLASLIPALWAARRDPIKAIHHE